MQFKIYANYTAIGHFGIARSPLMKLACERRNRYIDSFLPIAFLDYT